MIAIFCITSVLSERVYTRRHRKRIHVVDKVNTSVEEVHEVFRTALRPPSFTSSEVAIERFLKCDAMCYRRREMRKQRRRTTVSPNISTPITTETPAITESTTGRSTTPVITTSPRATLPTNPYANTNPDYTHISEWNHGPSITATKYPAESKNVNIQILEVENMTKKPAVTAEEPQELPTTTVPTSTDVYTTTSTTTEEPITSEEPRSTAPPTSTEKFTTTNEPSTTDIPTTTELPTTIKQTTTMTSTFDSTTSWYVEKKFIKEVPIPTVQADLDAEITITTEPAQEFDSSITEESPTTSTTESPVEYAEEFSTITAEGEDTDGIYYDGQYEDQDDDYDSNAENSDNEY